MIASNRSEKAIFSTQLPAGPEWNTDLLTTGVNVFDDLSAYATTEIPITVRDETSTSTSSSSIDPNLAESILQKSLLSKDADAVRSSLSILTTSLNNNYCGPSVLANSCNRLNREPCKATKETCGKCLAGFVGEDGDKNTACVDPLQISTDFVRRLTVGDNCNGDGDCGVWESCDIETRSCKATLKSCVQDCSGHGNCQYVTSAGQRELPLEYNCTLDNEMCSAQCACEEGYNGEICDYLTADFIDRQNVKYSMLLGLQELIESEDVTEDSIANWIETLESLYVNEKEYFNTSADFATSLVFILFDYVSQYDISSSSVRALQSVIDEVSIYESAVALSDMYGLLNSYTSSIVSKISPGESISLTTGKVSVSISSFSSVESNFVVQLPMTNLQALQSDTFLRSIEIVMNPEKVDKMTDVTIALLSLDSSLARANQQGIDRSGYGTLYRMGFGVDSDILKVIMSSGNPSGVQEAGSYAKLIMSNDWDVNYLQNQSYQSDWSVGFITNCSFGNVRRTLRTCPGSNVTIEHSCDGIGGEIRSSCPRYYDTLVPSCNIFVSNESPLDSGCELVSFDSMQTVCHCPLELFFSRTTANRRRLQGDDLEVDFVTVTNSESISTEFIPMFPSSKVVGLSVLICFSILITILIVVLSVSFALDDIDDKSIPVFDDVSSEAEFHHLDSIFFEGLPHILRPGTLLSKVIYEMRGMYIFHDHDHLFC